MTPIAQHDLDTDNSPTVPRWRRVVVSLVLLTYLFQMNLAWADIVAAGIANPGNKPLIDAAANGVPVVHIAPPSASGVSRNVYDQFNVDQRGLIFNNATQNTQTQLGGYITPNLQFGTKSATLILNEVTGTSTSHLRGFMEVAGPQAEIVIANPNGISCDGCGFINTSRATLTTGTPILGGDGAINGFNVNSGLLTIAQGGLNARNLAQLDLYARSLAIEGEVWAPVLKVIGGASQIDKASQNASGIAGSGPAPRFFLDVASLGGMYANQIYLVGTEQGLGVNSQGTIAALNGELSLSANGDVKLHHIYASGKQTLTTPGQLTLTGQTNADSTLHLTAKTVDNEGEMYLAGALALKADAFRNDGLLAVLDKGKTELQFGQNLINRGEIAAAGDLLVRADTLDGDEGRIQSQGKLDVAANAISLKAATVAAASDVTLAAPELNLQDTQLHSGKDLQLRGEHSLNLTGAQLGAERDITLTAAQIAASGSKVTANRDLQISTTGTLSNREGRLGAVGNVNVRAGEVDNDQGTIAASGQLQIDSQGKLINRAGTLSGTDKLSIKASSLDNLAGALTSTGTLALNTQAINNLGGAIQARDLTVKATTLNNQGGGVSATGTAQLDLGQIDNADGVLFGAGRFVLNAQAINNQDGQIGTTGEALIQAAAINNTGGLLIGDGALTLRSQAIDNRAGIISGQGAVAIDTQGAALDNRGGQIAASASLAITASTLNNQGGEVASQGALSLSLSELQNQQGSVLADGTLSASVGKLDNQGGVFGGSGSLNVQAGEIANTGGQLIAGSGQLNAASINNQGGVLGARGDLAIATGQLENSAGLLTTGGALSVNAGHLGNQGGEVSGGSLALGLGSLDNSGGLVTSQSTTRITVSSLNNAGGQIESLADVELDLAGSEFNNTGGRVIAGNDARITAQGIDNRGGVVTAGRDIALDALRGQLRNDAGRIEAGANLTLSAIELDNRNNGRMTAGRGMTFMLDRFNNDGATLASAGSMTLKVRETASNQGGTITAKGDLTLTADQVLNANGVLVADKDLSVTGTTRIDNQQGQIYANGALSVAGGELDNRAGVLLAEGKGQVTLTGLFNNQGGQLTTGQDLLISGAQLANGQGLIAASGQLGASVLGLDNQLGQLLAGDTLTLAATQIDNRRGVMATAGNFHLQADQQLDNQQGAIQAGGALELAGGAIRNTDGAISAGGDIRTAVGDLLNQRGTVIAGGEVSGTVASFDNAGGTLAAKTRINLQSSGAVNNTAGQLLAGTSLSLSAQGIDNRQGLINAQAALTLDGGNGQLNNAGGTIATADQLNLRANDIRNEAGGNALAGRGISIAAERFLNRNATMATDGALSAQITAAADNQQGTLVSAQALNFSAASLDNTGGTLASDQALSVSTTGALTNQQGTLSAGADMTVAAGELHNDTGKLVGNAAVQVAVTGALSNAGGQLFANQALDLRASSLDNAAGALASADTMQLDVTGLLTNRSGLIQSGAAAQLQAGMFNNDQGALNVAGDLALRLDTLSNAGGAIAANGKLDLALQSGRNGGGISTQQQLDLLAQGTFDNAGGRLLAETGLQLRAGSLITGAGGLLATNGDLSLTAQSWQQQGGTTATAGKATIRVDQIDNAAGSLQVQGDLDIAATSVSNTNGQIQTGGLAKLNVLQLSNQGGEISAAGAMQVATDTLNNAGVLLSSEQLAITTRTFTNAGGTLAGGQGLAVSAAEAMDNRQGQLLSDQNITVSGTELLNHGGLISAAGTAQVDVGTGALTLGSGQVHAVGQLTLNAKSASMTAGGAIASNEALTLQFDQLDSQGGVVQSTRDVTLDVQTLKLGANAAIAAGGDLQVNSEQVELDRAALVAQRLDLSAQTLRNTGGQMQADTSATVVVDQLINTAGGSVVANEGLTITAETVLNQGGSLSSALDLQLTAQQLDNDGGQLSATGNLQVSADQFRNQRNGQIVAGGNVRIDQPGVFVNEARIEAQGDITLANTELVNRGVINANRALQLNLSKLDNAGGTLGSGRDLRFTMDHINNRGGRILAQGTLSLDVNTLDNLGGTLSAGRDLALALPGELSNQGGVLQAGADVAVSANGINNSSGQIQAGSNVSLNTRGNTFENAGGHVGAGGGLWISAGQLNNGGGSVVGGSVSLSGSNVNNAGGQIGASSSVQINGGQLDNSSGSITSDGGLSLNVSSVANRGGSLISANSLNLGSLVTDNTGGTLASLGGDLSIDTVGQNFSNQSGRLYAAATLNLRAAKVGNDEGLLSATRIQVATTGEFSNLQGTVSAADALHMVAGGVRNEAGAIHSEGSLVLDLGTQRLDNRQGSVLAGGPATVLADGIDNRDGMVGAEGDLGMQLLSGLDNREGGKLLSNGALTLQTPQLLNEGGTIDALGAVTLDVSHSLNNQGGTLRSASLLKVTTPMLDNSKGGKIETADIWFKVAKLDNESGSISVMRDLLGEADSINNRGGALSAKGKLEAVADEFFNTDGTVSADGEIKLAAQRFSADGVIQSHGGAVLNFEGDYNNTGVVRADGSVTYNVAGTVTNAGTISAVDSLTVNADALTNQADALIVATTTQLNIAGLLDNQGTVDGNTVRVSAGTLDNTGRIYGNDLYVGGGTVDNHSGGVIAARHYLNIEVGSLTNQTAGEIRSLGNAAINAGTIQNIQTTIEAEGDLALGGSINNSGGEVTTSLKQGQRAEKNDASISETGPITRHFGSVVPGERYDGSRFRLLGENLPWAHYIGDTTSRYYGKPVYPTSTTACWPNGKAGSTEAEANCPRYRIPHDSPLFTQFNVEAPDSPEPAHAHFENFSDPEDAAWLAENAPKYAQLDAAISQWNAEVESANAYYEFQDYTWFRYIETTSELVAESLTPGQILAGGKLTVSGSLRNENSWVIAGGDIVGEGNIQNIGTEGYKEITTQGTAQFFWTDNDDDRMADEAKPYNPAPVRITTELSSTKKQKFAAVSIRDGAGGTTASAVGNVASDVQDGNGNTHAAQADNTQIVGGQTNAGGIGIPDVVAVDDVRVAINIRDPDAIQARSGGAADQVLVSETVDGADIGTPLDQANAGNGAGNIQLTGGTGPGAVNTPTTGTAPDALGTSGAADKPIVDAAIGGNAGAAAPGAGAAGGTATDPGQAGRAVDVVRTTGTVALPGSKLYQRNSEPGAKYLVETDPRFTQYKSFLGSDYYLSQLGMDPSRTLKRLGDGFYEQQQVSQQIMQLTGQRYLNGQSNDEATFKALMDAGVRYAQRFNLAPGISLSGEQMATLTDDMVLLEEQLIDGQKVLVPKVYLVRGANTDINTAGAVIAGNNVNWKTDGQFLNQGGTIAASNKLAIQAGSLLNEGGALAGKLVGIKTQEDLINRSGTITGTELVSLDAGRNLKLETRTIDTTGLSGTRTNIDRLATVQGGNVVLKAGQDIQMIGAQVNALGDLALQAGGKIDLQALAGRERLDIQLGNGNYIKSDSVFHQTTDLTAGQRLIVQAGDALKLVGANLLAGSLLSLSAASIDARAALDSVQQDSRSGLMRGWQQQGSYDQFLAGGQLVSGGDLLIKSTVGNIDLKGIQANAAGALALNGAQDINVGALLTEHSSYLDSVTKKKGLLSSKTTETHQRSEFTQAQGSMLTGNTVSLDAKRDLAVIGSNIAGVGDVNLKAGGKVDLAAAQQSLDDFYSQSVKKSGLMGTGGIGITVGSKKETTTNTTQSVLNTGSTIGSATGNLTVKAGTDLTVVGSDLVAGKDLTLTGQNVLIDSSYDTSQSRQTYEMKQSGLTLALTGGVVSQLETIAHAAKRIGQTDNDKLKTAYAVKAGYAAFDAVKGMSAAGDQLSGIGNQVGKAADGTAKQADASNGINLRISVGGSQQKSETNASSSTSHGSGLTATGDLKVIATGKQDADGKVQGGDLSIIGSNVVGQNVTLDAVGDLTLKSAADTTEQKSKNSGSSAAIGINIGTNGIGVYLGGSASKGKGDGNSVTHQETTITAGNLLTLKSGQDATLQGAIVKGDTIKADIAGDLKLHSEQDEDRYRNQQLSVSGEMVIGAGVSGNASLSASKTKSDYKSVVEQTGLFAGKGGFDINVGGNTDLKGAVIASDAGADKNKLSTGSLTYSDLQNEAEYEAYAISVSAGTGGFSGSIAPPTSKDASGTTKSAIAAGAIDVRSDASGQSLVGLSRDAAHANDGAVGKIFDQQKVEEQQELGKVIGEVGFRAVGDLASSRKAAAAQELADAKASGDPARIKEAETSVDRWAEGGAYKIALHTAMGAVQAWASGGNVGAGALGAGINEAALPVLIQNLNDQGYKEGTAEFASLLKVGSTLLGAVAGSVAGSGMTGAGVALDATSHNYLKHDEAKKLLSELNACKASKCSEGQYKEILGRYEAISVANSAEMMTCESRACVERHLAEINAYDKAGDPTLAGLNGFSRKLGYDTIGVAKGNPNLIASPNLNPANKLGGNIFVLDKDSAVSKLITNNWLTPQEMASLDEWNKRTAWLDKAAAEAGHTLTLEQKGQLIAQLYVDTGFTSAAAVKNAVQDIGKAISAIAGKTGKGASALAEQTGHAGQGIKNGEAAGSKSGGVNVGTGKANGGQTLKDIDGPTAFTAPPMSQVPTGKNAGERLGPLGEVDIAKPVLDTLSPGYRPLQNASGHGSDGLGVVDHANKRIPAFEIKTTDTGNRQSVGDLTERTKKWINDAAGGQINGQELSTADGAYADSLQKLLDRGYTIKPYVVEVAVPAQGQSGRPVVTVIPSPRPTPMPRPKPAPLLPRKP